MLLRFVKKKRIVSFLKFDKKRVVLVLEFLNLIFWIITIFFPNHTHQLNLGNLSKITFFLRFFLWFYYLLKKIAKILSFYKIFAEIRSDSQPELISPEGVANMIASGCKYDCMWSMIACGCNTLHIVFLQYFQKFDIFANFSKTWYFCKNNFGLKYLWENPWTYMFDYPHYQKKIILIEKNKSNS